jgi:acyl carrier protein
VRFLEESCFGMRFFRGVCLSACVMDDSTGAYLLIGVVTRSFLLVVIFFFFWQGVARFNGLKVIPVFKQGPTSSLALRRTVASRRCRPRHISAAAAPETLEVVTEVIAGQLAIDVAQVQAESKFTDLGADSLDTVEIMMALEEKFDIQLDEDNAEKIVTVQHAADLIHDVVAAKKA